MKCPRNPTQEFRDIPSVDRPHPSCVFVHIGLVHQGIALLGDDIRLKIRALIFHLSQAYVEQTLLRRPPRIINRKDSDFLIRMNMKIFTHYIKKSNLAFK